MGEEFMVFPVETEERGRRRALSLCQDHLREVVEVVRKVTQMVDSFVKDDRDSAQRTFTDITKMEEVVDAANQGVAQELAQIGGVLMNREDFLRFTNQASEIANFCKGIGFRLLEILDMKAEVSPGIKDGLVKLAGGMFDSVVKLRETAITLNYNSAKALEKATEVEAAERIVDDLFRGLEVSILSSEMRIPVLLLLRDVAQLLEDATDKAEDASDAARILAFAM